MKTKAAGIIFFFLLLDASPARASDPSLARYTDDPSRVFWFVQITDTHIDNPLFSGEEDKLTWALTTGVGVVDPYFVVNTGDLTDSTEGDIIPIYGTGPHPEEWDEYRDIVDGAGMTADFYYDLVGNHDVYGDDGASYYLSRSVQGSTQHTTQPDWRIDLPFGSYHFVAVATTCNDWAQWPFDNTEITDEEYDEILDNLEANTDTHLTIAAGHHDYTTARNGVSVDELFAAYGVPYYIHGHIHDFRARVTDNGVVIQRVDSLGQGNENNFCVHAVDADAFSLACTSAVNPWPLAVITAPVDAMLDDNDDVDNPYAPSVPTTCAEAPLRALVFDAVAVSAVTYWWSDASEVGGLAPSARVPSQWTGTFNAAALNPGLHTLNLEVIGTETRDFHIQVRFENRACDVTPPPPDEEMEEVAEEPAVEETEPREDAVESADAPDTGRPDAAVDASDDTSAEEEDNGLGGRIYGGGCSCDILPPL